MAEKLNMDDKQKLYLSAILGFLLFRFWKIIHYLTSPKITGTRAGVLCVCVCVCLFTCFCVGGVLGNTEMVFGWPVRMKSSTRMCQLTWHGAQCYALPVCFRLSSCSQASYKLAKVCNITWIIDLIVNPNTATPTTSLNCSSSWKWCTNICIETLTLFPSNLLNFVANFSLPVNTLDYNAIW